MSPSRTIRSAPIPSHHCGPSGLITLHLLAAAPNVFLKPLAREKAIVKTDIENEELETFGLGKVSELNWKNVLNLYACTECGRCEEQCPAANTDKPLSPKKVVHDLKVDLLEPVRRHSGWQFRPGQTHRP